MEFTSYQCWFWKWKFKLRVLFFFKKTKHEIAPFSMCGLNLNRQQLCFMNISADADADAGFLSWTPIMRFVVLLVCVDTYSCVIPLQVGSWTVRARVWSSHHAATFHLVLGSGCVWVRPWPRWNSSSFCPGSYNALLSPSHQVTLCPVWRASLVWSSSRPSTRWMLHPDQAGRKSARHVEIGPCSKQQWHSVVIWESVGLSF